MADAEIDLGVIAFRFGMATMLMSAGIAATLPARHVRLLIGALLDAGLLLVVTFFLSVSVGTSTLFIFDIMVAIAFFYLAKPEKITGTDDLRNNDWASYVCAIYLLIAIVEFIGSTKFYDYQTKNILIAIASIFWLLVGVGFIRGFGIRPFGLFSIASAATIFCTLTAYAFTLNIVSILPTLIITFKSLQVIKEHFTK